MEFNLFIAILILIVSIFLVYRYRKNSSLSKITILLAGLFITIVTLVYPLYDESENELQRIVFSILYSIQCIYVGQDFEFIQNEMLIHNVSSLYYFVVYVCFLLAPTFTTGVIITLIENTVHKIKCRFSLLNPSKREVHIFSNINKESATLAESINNHKCVLIFCNEKEEKVKESLRNRIHKIGGITINDSELEIKVSNKKTFFYEISEDEMQNMDNSMKLIEKYRYNKNIKVTVFSTRKEAEILLDSLDREINVALINKNKYALYHLLEKRPILKYSKDGLTSVLIMGEHNRVLEIIKMVLWSMQLDNQKVEIHVIDKQATKLQNILYHQAPGLKEEKYRLFFYNADIETEEIDSIIKDFCQNTTYIILAMKDDKLNIDTAVYLREYFLFLDKNNYSNQPPIHIWLNDEIKGIETLGINDNNYAKTKDDSKSIGYNFYPFGTTEQIYSEVSILNTKLEQFALMLHLANVGVLNKPKEKQEIAKRTYKNREKTRKYALTCAIHLKYSLYTKGINLFDNNINMELVNEVKYLMTQEDEVYSLMKSDMKMWNTFWRTEGFRRVSFEEASVYYNNKEVKSYQHTLAKLNPCLTDLDEFEENEKQLEKIIGKRPEFIKAEENYIRSFPIVLEKLLNEEEIW